MDNNATITTTTTKTPIITTKTNLTDNTMNSNSSNKTIWKEIKNKTYLYTWQFQIEFAFLSGIQFVHHFVNIGLEMSEKKKLNSKCTYISLCSRHLDFVTHSYCGMTSSKPEE